MTDAQEIVPKSEHEAQKVDRNSQQSPGETTEELFRRASNTSKEESSALITPTSAGPRSTSLKVTAKPKESATKKKSNSGIPLRLKTAPVKSVTKTGTYRHPTSSTMGPVINKNTLEMQFLNNKKRLLQLHAELVEKQRPLLEMHKSLIKTKKQLEELGKKVVLDDLKIISLKNEEVALPKCHPGGAGENTAFEDTMILKSSIENVLEECVQVCKKCLGKNDNVVAKMLESASKSGVEPDELETEMAELKKEKMELEQSVENTIRESEKKIEQMLVSWQKASAEPKALSKEITDKIASLEETIKQQQKYIQEADDNIHSITRKYEDKKTNLEKTNAELLDKYNKVEEEMKKEKKASNDSIAKARNMRVRVAELEVRTKEAEDKNSELTKKLKQVQEHMQKKEVQWVKEKEELKKHEAFLQQKFSERQSQLDARIKEMESNQKTTDKYYENCCRNLETQMEIKEQEFTALEKEKDLLTERCKTLETQLEENENRIDEINVTLKEKEKKIAELEQTLRNAPPAIEYKASENEWMEVTADKQKVLEAQKQIEHLNDQISKMSASLKAHTKLAAALKLEKDNAIEHSKELRKVLHQARDELDFKTKTIYKIHEKLVLKEKICDKLTSQLKAYEEFAEFPEEKWSSKNRCQICMTSMGEKYENSSCVESEVGKSLLTGPQYVSESLIGMSVKKVDNLRARLDNLKKMKLPCSHSESKHFDVRYSWSHRSCESKPISSTLRKQIELRGKLYKILQKHADQSCEDFINLLKLTVSNNGNEGSLHDELKPSNINEVVDNYTPRELSSKIKITKYIDGDAVRHIRDQLHGISDFDDFIS